MTYKTQKSVDKAWEAAKTLAAQNEVLDEVYKILGGAKKKTAEQSKMQEFYREKRIETPVNLYGVAYFFFDINNTKIQEVAGLYMEALLQSRDLINYAEIEDTNDYKKAPKRCRKQIEAIFSRRRQQTKQAPSNMPKWLQDLDAELPIEEYTRQDAYEEYRDYVRRYTNGAGLELFLAALVTSGTLVDENAKEINTKASHTIFTTRSESGRQWIEPIKLLEPHIPPPSKEFFDIKEENEQRVEMGLGEIKPRAHQLVIEQLIAWTLSVYETNKEFSRYILLLIEDRGGALLGVDDDSGVGVTDEYGFQS